MVFATNDSSGSCRRSMTEGSRMHLQVVHALLIAAVILSGCRGNSASEVSGPEDGFEAGIEALPEEAFETLTEGRSGDWPDYIPDDIPRLEGEIESIWETPESHIRMRYRNLSLDKVKEYLDLLEGLGFSLEYRVYVQEGFPDRSEEKMARGDYDDVVITMGEYRLGISYNADPTLDVYTSGFREEAIAAIREANRKEWPSAIPDSVPQIPDCDLQQADPGELSSYDLSCLKQTEHVEDDYLLLLEGAGFERRDRAIFENLVLEQVVYENAEAIVYPLLGSTSSRFNVVIYVKDQSAPPQDDLPEGPVYLVLPNQWPEGLDGLVPEPANCEITSASEYGGTHSVSCVPFTENVFADYMMDLTDAGFEELYEATEFGEGSLTGAMGSSTVQVTVFFDSTFNRLDIGIFATNP
jgi:hypothetical protein